MYFGILMVMKGRRWGYHVGATAAASSSVQGAPWHTLTKWCTRHDDVFQCGLYASWTFLKNAKGSVGLGIASTLDVHRQICFELVDNECLWASIHERALCASVRNRLRSWLPWKRPFQVLIWIVPWARLTTIRFDWTWMIWEEKPLSLFFSLTGDVAGTWMVPFPTVRAPSPTWTCKSTINHAYYILKYPLSTLMLPVLLLFVSLIITLLHRRIHAT